MPAKLKAGVIVVLLLTVGCGGDPATAARVLARLELRPLSRTIVVKEQMPVVVAAFTAGNGFMPAPKIEWTSSDTSVATVDPYGLITGVRIGRVEIRASSGDVSAGIGIDVRAKILKISVASGPADLLVGQTAILRARFLDYHGQPIATDLPVSWMSADSQVVQLQHPPGLSNHHIQISAQGIGLARVLATADATQGVYGAPVVTESVAPSPVDVADFQFVQVFTVDDFPSFTPSVWVRVAPGRRITVLRAEVVVEDERVIFPALCGSTYLVAGAHEIIGRGSYPSDVSRSLWPQWRDHIEGVALLTYADETGAVRARALRGATNVSVSYEPSKGLPWHFCS